MVSKAVIGGAHFQPEARQVALLQVVVNQKANANSQRHQADRGAGQHITLSHDERQHDEKQRQSDATRNQHDGNPACVRQALHRSLTGLLSTAALVNNLSMSLAGIPRATMAIRCSAVSLCLLTSPTTPEMMATMATANAPIGMAHTSKCISFTLLSARLRLPPRLPHPGPDAEQQFAEKQFRYSVEQQLQVLSPIERTILVLYHQEERSYEQIALSLKLPIGTVRTHLHRGRNKLRQGIQRQQEMERGTAWQRTR
jgi:RNA polymerase sigma factor (sigma-70 family)